MWDVLEEAAVSNYRGHNSSLLCVDWSPVDPDVVWSGGKDFSVHEWKVSKQEFTKPPKGTDLHLHPDPGKTTGPKPSHVMSLPPGKKMVLLHEKNATAKQQKKKNKMTAVSAGGAGPKSNGEPGPEGDAVETVMSEGDEEEVKSTNSLEAPGGEKKQK